MLTQNDMFLRPALVSSCSYDLQTGSINCWTPLQYGLNYRNYLYVCEGTITIKLIPPIYSQFNILLGILMLFLGITPWISAICIRIALRNK